MQAKVSGPSIGNLNMQVKPTPRLADIVRHFLIIESDGPSAMRIFSDGNTGIVFNYGDPLLFQSDIAQDSGMLPESFVYGQLDHYRNVFAQGKLRLLIAVLNPFGAAALFKIPASELRDQIIGCTHLWGQAAGILFDEIASEGHISDKIGAAERFLMLQMQHTQSSNTLITNAIQIVHNQNGLVTVAQLTGITGATERQLQRQFEAHIGISPKRYAGITRMQHALKMLRKKPFTSSFAGIAYDAGFFDQAHLIREMKNLSGLTPGQYLHPQNLLAANFIQLGR